MTVRRRTLAYVLAGALAVGLGALAWERWRGPTTEAPATYVGGQTCATCHADQARQWAGSHHDLAMREPTPETVRGDFNDRTFTHQGVTSRFFRNGDRYLVTTEGPTGQAETYPVKYTFGIEPLQQYLIEFPGGRLQALSVAWDTQQKRWFHLYPNERIPPHDWLHWTKGGQNWNYMCAECHSTNLAKNYDIASDTYETTFSEINVSCEACHGPGSTHVELAQSTFRALDRRWSPEQGHGLAPLKNVKVEVDACARCHSRRGIVKLGFEPGHDFLDHYAPELLDGPQYHDDGQILEEVYEYGSFLQSKMHRRGVRCTDCHNPHTTRPRAEGNALCGRCHVPGKYDTPLHHHHTAGTPGAQCVECHMPARNYMVVDPRRDHSLRVPRPDLSVTLKTPNACTGCHKDRPAEWAAAQVVAWYGPTRPDDPHPGPALAAGKAGRPEGAALLAALLRRDDVSPIVRASAASLLGHYPDRDRRAALGKLLADPHPLVRFGAVRGLDRNPGEDLARLLPPLLDDPVRLVRTEAARSLASLGPDGIPSTAKEAFRRARAEYEEAQLATAEIPGAHLNLGVLREQFGEFDRAESEYRAALRIDPRFTPARYNLAMLHNRRGDRPAAERALRELIEQEPNAADAHYSLGLLLAEDERRLSEAAEVLAQAARLAPERARVQYNYGLALQRLGKYREAEEALRRAHEREPASGDAVYALAVLHAQQKRWSEAQAWADKLVQLDPQNPTWQQFRLQLRRQQK